MGRHDDRGNQLNKQTAAQVPRGGKDTEPHEAPKHQATQGRRVNTLSLPETPAKALGKGACLVELAGTSCSALGTRPGWRPLPSHPRPSFDLNIASIRNTSVWECHIGDGTRPNKVHMLWHNVGILSKKSSHVRNIGCQGDSVQTTWVFLKIRAPSRWLGSFCNPSSTHQKGVRHFESSSHCNLDSFPLVIHNTQQTPNRHWRLSLSCA